MFYIKVSPTWFSAEVLRSVINFFNEIHKPFSFFLLLYFQGDQKIKREMQLYPSKMKSDSMNYFSKQISNPDSMNYFLLLFSRSAEKLSKVSRYISFILGILSDEIILGQLTNETGKDAIADFIKRKLIRCDEYIENIHYKIIKKDDPLVITYVNLYSANLRNRKVSNRKKYYAITGDTYEDLLMKSNTKNGRFIRHRTMA